MGTVMLKRDRVLPQQILLTEISLNAAAFKLLFKEQGGLNQTITALHQK